MPSDPYERRAGSYGSGSYAYNVAIEGVATRYHRMLWSRVVRRREQLSKRVEGDLYGRVPPITKDWLWRIPADYESVREARILFDRAGGIDNGLYGYFSDEIDKLFGRTDRAVMPLGYVISGEITGGEVVRRRTEQLRQYSAAIGAQARHRVLIGAATDLAGLDELARVVEGTAGGDVQQLADAAVLKAIVLVGSTVGIVDVEAVRALIDAYVGMLAEYPWVGWGEVLVELGRRYPDRRAGFTEVSRLLGLPADPARTPAVAGGAAVVGGSGERRVDATVEQPSGGSGQLPVSRRLSGLVIPSDAAEGSGGPELADWAPLDGWRDEQLAEASSGGGAGPAGTTARGSASADVTVEYRGMQPVHVIGGDQGVDVALAVAEAIGDSASSVAVVDGSVDPAGTVSTPGGQFTFNELVGRLLSMNRDGGLVVVFTGSGAGEAMVAGQPFDKAMAARSGATVIVPQEHAVRLDSGAILAGLPPPPVGGDRLVALWHAIPPAGPRVRLGDDLRTAGRALPAILPVTARTLSSFDEVDSVIGRFQAGLDPEAADFCGAVLQRFFRFKYPNGVRGRPGWLPGDRRRPPTTSPLAHCDRSSCLTC